MSPITYKPLRPHKVQPRTDLLTGQDEILRRLIFQFGLAMTWEQAAACPCQRVAATQSITPTVSGPTGERRADCAGCRGTGRIYHSSTEITAIVTSAARNPQRFAAYGLSLAGAVMVTLLPENQPGFLDRLTLTTSTIPYTETRQRTASVVESLRYPVASRTFASANPADPTGVTSLDQTLTVAYATKTDATGAIVLGGDGTPIVLTAAVDFDVTGEGKIDWTKGIALGSAPAVGAWYSMSYPMHPVYTVRNHPHVTRDTLTQWKQASATQKFLMVQADCWLEWMGA